MIDPPSDSLNGLTFASWPERDLVTVLKGSHRKGKALQDVGPWLPFRERDRIREARVLLGDNLSVRVVEMERVGSGAREAARPAW